MVMQLWVLVQVKLTRTTVHFWEEKNSYYICFSEYTFCKNMFFVSICFLRVYVFCEYTFCRVRYTFMNSTGIRFVSIRFVSIHFVSIHLVTIRFVSIRFVEYESWVYVLWVGYTFSKCIQYTPGAQCPIPNTKKYLKKGQQNRMEWNRIECMPRNQNTGTVTHRRPTDQSWTQKIS
jgi:hypothetical protein